MRLGIGNQVVLIVCYVPMSRLMTNGFTSWKTRPRRPRQGLERLAVSVRVQQRKAVARRRSVTGLGCQSPIWQAKRLPYDARFTVTAVATGAVALTNNP